MKNQNISNYYQQSKIKSDKNLHNKGYLLNNIDKEIEEKEFKTDLKNLSIDEKLSTKKINKMLDNNYKFFQKKTEILNFDYEEPENDYFNEQSARKEFIKKAAPPLAQQIINEKTEENNLEATDTYIVKEKLRSVVNNNYSQNQLKNIEFSLSKNYIGHKNTVNALAYDPESKNLWSGSHDYSIKVIKFFEKKL